MNSKFEELEKCKSDIYNCVRCGYCREMVYPQTETYGICPVWEKFGFESYYGRGKVNIARALLEGNLKMSKPLADRLFTCLLCKNCTAHCGNEVDVPNIVRAMREEAVKEGFLPDNIKRIESNVKRYKNVFGENADKRKELASALNLPKTGDYLYFAGCYATYRYPDTAKATTDILKKAGIELSYLGEDEWCCGIIETEDGQPLVAKEIMKHNLDKIKESGAKKVVVSCAGCYHSLKQYKEILGEGTADFEVLHISQVIDDLIKKGKIKLNNSINETVTYHDPCHLGRYEEVYDAPRDVLKAMPGTNLIEMKRNKKNAWCCGGGTVVYANDPKLSIDIAAERATEAKATGAKGIVTCCPLCITNLKQGLRKAGIDMDIYDLPVLVARSMK